MATNPTTGLYDLTGGDTSAVATDGINDNFTTLWLRDEWAEGEINSLEGRPYIVSSGIEDSTTTINGYNEQDQGTAFTPVWYYRIWSNGYYEAYTYVDLWVHIHPSGANANVNAIDSITVGSQTIPTNYIYEIPRINYPTAITTLPKQFDPLEEATLHTNVGGCIACPRMGNGINTGTQTAQYGIARNKWSDVSRLHYAITISIKMRSNEY